MMTPSLWVKDAVVSKESGSATSFSATSAISVSFSGVDEEAAEAFGAAFLGIKLVCYFAQQGRNLPRVVVIGVATVAQVTAAAIQKLDQVLHDDGHVFRTFTAVATCRGVQHPDAQRLGTALALSDAKLHAGAVFHDVTRRQCRGVKEHLFAIIRLNEAKAFVLVIKLDLAAGHGAPFFRGA